MPRLETMYTNDAGELIFDPDPELRAIISPSLHEVLSYWRKKAAGRPGPQRGDIRPAEIAHVLPMIFLADVIDEGVEFRFRLIGTGLTRVVGEDWTGKLVSECYRPELTERLIRVLSHVVKHRAPLRTVATVSAIEGFSAFRGENLFLPLFEGGDNVAVVLAACDLLEPESMGGEPSNLIVKPRRKH